MKSKIFSVAVFCVLFVSTAFAQKPIVIVSVKNADALMKIGEKYADLVDKKSDFEKLKTQFESFGGIVYDQPAAVVMMINDKKAFGQFLFLPVSDLEKVIPLPMLNMMLAGQGAEIKKKQSGLYTLAIQGRRQNTTLEHSNNGLYIFDQAQKSFIPKSGPSSLLEGLDKEYDIAIRVNLGNIPSDVQNNLLQMFDMLGMFLGGNPEVAAFLPQAKEVVSNIFKNVDAFTFGIKVDPQTGDADVVVSVKAVSGSEFANIFEIGNKAKTNFVGFTNLDGTMISATTSSIPLDNNFRKQIPSVLNQRYEGIVAALKTQGLKPNQEKIASQLVEQIRNAVLEIIAQPTVDAAFSVTNNSVIVGGIAMPDTKKIATLISSIKSEAADNVKIDYDTVEGYTLSSIKFDPPEGMVIAPTSPAVLLEGGSLLFVFGVKDNAACFAVGRDKYAETVLKAAISGSKSPAASPKHVYRQNNSEINKTFTKYYGETPESKVPTAKKLHDAIEKNQNAGVFVETDFKSDTATLKLSVDGSSLAFGIVSFMVARETAAESARKFYENQQPQRVPQQNQYEDADDEFNPFN